MAKQVLIAIDDAESREETARNLKSWGYEAILAGDGVEAWQILQRPDAPRIALLDADLAGLDTFELCRRSRDINGDDSFVLVLASNNARSLDALEAGADGVIEKPVHARELRMRLSAGMRGRRIAASDAPRSLAPLSMRDPSDASAVGRIVARKYRLERIVGRGGMGTVWEGTHLLLGMRVAVKFIKGDYARQSLAKARFELEAKAAASLRTKYAVKVFDCGVTSGGVPYLVMEYLEGPSLLRYVATRGPLSFGETVAMVAQAAQALGEAHSLGIIHRDVKPDNVIMVADPDAQAANSPPIAKLIDFGIAKVLSDIEGASNGMTTATGIVVGTPNFMPPEQLRGIGKSNVAADLWGLAACAYTAITGRVPFEGSTMSEVFYRVCEADAPVPSQENPCVPPEFDAWFAQACDPNPAKRFGTARELAAALARAHAEYTDACLDLSPSLTTFVGQRSSATVRVAAAPVSALRALFDLDDPLSATSA